MSEQKQNPNHILIKNVRLSFPSIFAKAVFEGKETKFESTFILDPAENADAIAALKKAAAELMTSKFKKMLPADRIFLKSDEHNGGADGSRPEYAGKFTAKASSTRRPVIVDQGRNRIEEDNGMFYSGCYVNGKVSLWAQDNKFGKRVNAELIAVQFAKDGESLDGSYISPEAAMDGFEDTFDPDDANQMW